MLRACSSAGLECLIDNQVVVGSNPTSPTAPSGDSEGGEIVDPIHDDSRVKNLEQLHNKKASCGDLGMRERRGVQHCDKSCIMVESMDSWPSGLRRDEQESPL